MKIVKFQMEELTCPSCIKKIERALLKLEGVPFVMSGIILNIL